LPARQSFDIAAAKARHPGVLVRPQRKISYCSGAALARVPARIDAGDDGMRRSIMMIAAMAALLLPIPSLAGSLKDPGAGFIGQKRPKASKNYYLVRKDKGCAIVSARTGEKPEGVVGDAPYAGKNYAKAALKTFPECKGGLVEEDKFESKKDD
jgi:hypothetical protein